MTTLPPCPTTPARAEAPDVAELRRLAEAATPGPWWHEWVDGDDWWAVYGQPTGDMVCPEVCTTGGSDESAYIAAANPAVVLGLLDATDALRAESARMTEARNNARAATNPATTVREDDSRVRELQARLDKAASILRAASGTWDSAAEDAIGEALTALGVE